MHTKTFNKEGVAKDHINVRIVATFSPISLGRIGELFESYSGGLESGLLKPLQTYSYRIEDSDRSAELMRRYRVEVK